MNPCLKIILFFFCLFAASWAIMGCSTSPRVYRLPELDLTIVIHVIKPSGVGNYFIQRTQTLLFGYKTKCKFPLDRYKPNILEVSDPKRHSEKWEETYALIESISLGPRLELFARHKRSGWDVWGNEVDSDIYI